MRNHSLSGVLYAEDFDAPERVEALPAEPAPAKAEPVVIEPTFSLLDLQRASDHARQEERASTRQQAEQDATVLRTQALLQLADAVTQARAGAARIATEAADATAQTVLAMVAALLPAFSAAQGATEMTALLRLLLPVMKNEPLLTVRAHPSLIAQLKNETASLLDAGNTVVEWIGSETMLVGDLAVRWLDGSMVRDTTALCTQITGLIMQPRTTMNENQETADAH